MNQANGERWPLKRLHPNPKNPRVIVDEKFKQLVKSLREFPEMLEARPIVCTPAGVVLGGNMRLKACKEAGIKEVPVFVAQWPEEKHGEFIVKDNVSFGAWDWDALANEWETGVLEDWGLDIWNPDIDAEEMADAFSLPDGEKPPFQQMTFTLADEQAEQIQNAITAARGLEEFKYVETFGNENGNGNALYLLVMQWAEQRK